MIRGSVLSVGAAYPRDLDVGDLADRVTALLGSMLLPARAGPDGSGRWPLRFASGGAHEAWAEVELREEEPATWKGLLTRWMQSTYGELEATVAFPGGDHVDVVLRPELRFSGLLMDLPEAQLFEAGDAETSDRQRAELLTAGVRELLIAWYQLSPYRRAFADHEAELAADPLEIGLAHSPYALLAEPGGSAEGPPVRFREAAWRLSPHGG